VDLSEGFLGQLILEVIFGELGGSVVERLVETFLVDFLEEIM